MAITKERLHVAGWLSIINSAVIFPSFVIALLRIVIQRFTQLQVPLLILSFISLGLFIYIFLSLRRLLNSRFNFHHADVYISALIWITIISSIIGLLSSLIESELLPAVVSVLTGILPVLTGILLGIICIVFAIRILRLSEDLFGLLRPFSYLLIARGVCLMTVILGVLLPIIEVILYIILAMVFFRAAEAIT